MKFKEKVDLFLLSLLNKIDNYFKYSKLKSQKYAESDRHDQQNNEFQFYKENLSKILKLLDNDAFNKKILDIGCGTGRYMKLFPHAEITGIDINSNMLKHAKKLKNINNRISLYNCDIYGLDNFSNKKRFDFIYSIGVFGEHAYLDEFTIRKIISNLNVNGYFFFTLYLDGIRKKNFIKRILIFLKICTSFIGLTKTSMFISRGHNIEKVLEKFHNIEVIEKYIKITQSKNWNGSHMIIILKKLK